MDELELDVSGTEFSIGRVELCSLGGDYGLRKIFR